ncbi:hypothetical protein BDU57DRAFT_198216 [Ampelomyces quisqualis]|uniref:Uncharacterized protein n=1 Tax=Ampelomyces quisqualis TaxID=50730 RepID=A0A6A5QSP1_AMPQU|nr:hypothetical protein BDU57DRAFT_198216 [Ampelomyces quisqualis]
MMERPSPTDRKTSFNPEATAFSPIATPVKPVDVQVSSPGAFDDDFSRILELPSQDSPLISAKNLRASHGKEDGQAHMPSSIQNQLDSGVPISSLTGTIEDSSTNPTQSMICTSHFQQALPYHALAFYYPHSSLHDLDPIPTVPDFQFVDIDELSTGLGLPSAKKVTKPSGTPKYPHKYQSSQDVQNPLYERYLRSPSGSSEETVRAFSKHKETPRGQVTSFEEQDPPLKVVLPPPGFVNQMPRMVTVEEEVPPTAPALMRYNNTHTATHDYFNPFSMQTQPSPFSERYVRRPSTRRRPRGHTRTKRTDQGPEPSAADIYPDDANWKSGPPCHHQSLDARMGFEYMAARPQEEVLRPDDSKSWPTPAEVYTHKSRIPVAPLAHIPQVSGRAHQVFERTPQKPAHAPQVFDVFSSHSYPSTEDIRAADCEVLSLIDELPEPTITTLINFGAFDLIADDRPLSPGQKSGKRYGLNFYGVGLGDDWKPPPVAMNEPFDPHMIRPGYDTVWNDKIKSCWSDV